MNVSRRLLFPAIAGTVALVAGASTYEADEFVNLLTAQRWSSGDSLYAVADSHHPPLMTWMLALLLPLPISHLVASRILMAVLAGASIWMADRVYRRVTGDRGELFLVLACSSAFFWTVAGRATNETVALFFLTAAIASGAGRNWTTGVFGVLAVATRFSAAFFAPAVLALRPGGKAWLAGAGAVAAILLMMGTGHWGAFWHDVAGYHLGREAQFVPERLVKFAAFSGLPFALWAWLRRPRGVPLGRWGRLLAWAYGGGAAMALLPVVHPHYFLPLSLASVACVAWTCRREKRKVAAIAWVVANVGLAGAYVFMTPVQDYGQARDVAQEIALRTPESAVVLADSPQFAMLAQRDVYAGYYWSLQGEVDVTQWQGDVALVVQSERFGRYDFGYEPDVAASFHAWPCLQAPGARIYVPDVAGWPYPPCTA